MKDPLSCGAGCPGTRLNMSEPSPRLRTHPAPPPLMLSCFTTQTRASCLRLRVPAPCSSHHCWSPPPPGHRSVPSAQPPPPPPVQPCLWDFLPGHSPPPWARKWQLHRVKCFEGKMPVKTGEELYARPSSRENAFHGVGCHRPLRRTRAR